jgi:hypothetical protein
VDALQTVLAGEHAAVYAYGVIGARLTRISSSGSQTTQARAGYDTHRQRRAAATALLVAAGSQPVAAAPAYDLGGPAVTAAELRALAARIELHAATTYASLVAASTDTVRSSAAAWLSDSAVRQALWSGHAETFPGLSSPAS